MFVKQRIKIYLSVIILLSAALGIPAFTVYAESKTMAVLEDAQETQRDFSGKSNEGKDVSCHKFNDKFY